MYQQEEKAQIHRRQSERAIQLALANRWEEAVDANKAIIDLFPNDADSYNRLGKALMELAKYPQAKKAYKKATELDPTNQIAKKNLSRITVLAKSGVAPPSASQVDPTLFLEATGKSTITELRDPDPKVLTKLDAGDRVVLAPQKQTVIVESTDGERIGIIEPKLGLRLVKLIEGGNQYGAAITSVGDRECRIIVKETYQDPSQLGRPSFPAGVATEATRPYTKQRLVRYEPQADDTDDGETVGADAEGGSWDDDAESQEGDVRLSDAAAAEDVDDDDEMD